MSNPDHPDNSDAANSPTKRLTVPERSSSIRVQKRLPGGSIPERTSSKRRVSQAWDNEFCELTPDELNGKIQSVGKRLRNSRKALKRQISMDEEYWDNYLEISRLQATSAQVLSQMRKDKPDETPDEEWYTLEKAQELKRQHDSWTQWVSIMTRHKSKIQARLASGRESFVKLFATSPSGFNLPGGMGERDNSLQGEMAELMYDVYCPDRPAPSYRWDPVIGEYFDSKAARAAHLFPWRQSAYMNDIFSKGSYDELFRPENGLFLHWRVEDALDKGRIAIVPDVDLDPADPLLPMNDQQEIQDRVKAWENEKVKNYKVIVLNRNDPEVTKIVATKKDLGIQAIGELHGRKLKFQTDFRPRARYIWWTFLNAVLQNAWRDSSRDDNIQHIEVRKATRYWGTRRNYVKRNQLLGFVEEIGHDVESILTVGSEAGAEDGDPAIEATQALVAEAIANSAKSVYGDEEESDDESDDE
ncbi:hypothetical protein LZL87_010313 [Fusarium oxysporum]|nr:hypothetical protein LZL87_010313 [Fusarium oxysporum]